MTTPGHPETRQKDVTHLSMCEGSCSEHITVSESHNHILPGSDAVGIPNYTFGTINCHTDIIGQKLCEKKNRKSGFELQVQQVPHR